MRNMLFIIGLLVTTACTQTTLAVVNLPSNFKHDVTVHTESYGPEPWQKLDIYDPGTPDGKVRDVIVFFYGGRWIFGEKDDFKFVGRAFAKRGYIVVIPNYRKYPDTKFPGFVQDGAKALAWTHSNIARFQGSANNIHVSGHSAGAHLGAMLCADERYLAAEGKQTSIIRDFVGLAGPYAFIPEEPDLKDIFGPPENYPQMQAPTFIDGNEPPMLLLHGEKDRAVGLFNLEKLEAKIKEKGGKVEKKIYPNVNHTDIIGALSWINTTGAPVLDDTVKYFQQKTH